MADEKETTAPAQAEAKPVAGAAAGATSTDKKGGERGGGRRGGRGGHGGGRGGPGGRGGREGRGGRKQEGPPSEFEEEVIQIDRVTRVVKGGRRLRFRATVVVGNKKGKVGLGLGKSVEVRGAIQKATAQAKKRLITVPLINGTIPHEVYWKFKSAKILLKPASQGTGIIAGGSVRKVAELVGIQNILSKILGASNRITNAKATLLALKKLRSPAKAPVEPDKK